MDFAIPSNFPEMIASSTADTFVGVSPVVALIVGILLAFIVIDVILYIARGGREAQGGVAMGREEETFRDVSGRNFPRY